MKCVQTGSNPCDEYIVSFRDRNRLCDKRDDKVIGMHFFNPAPVMKLVEMIPGKHISGDDRLRR